MPTTFGHADPHDYELLERAARRFNPDLVVCGAKVGLLFADNPDSPPLVRSGDRCAAIVSVVPLVQRQFNKYDALVRIDRDIWDALPDRSQEALLAHELCHLVVARESRRPSLFDGDTVSAAGNWWKTDDLGRPVLKTRAGDWCSSDGFKAVADHYGPYALELRALDRAQALALAPTPLDAE